MEYSKPWDNIPDFENRGRNVKLTPKELLNKAVMYFEMTDERVWTKPLFVGKEGREVDYKMKVPFTLEGFFVFAQISNDTFIDYKNRYKKRSCMW